jgi:hypothetical protein
LPTPTTSGLASAIFSARRRVSASSSSTGAEEAYPHTGGGEAGVFGGDDEVAGGSELASGGGSDAVDLGNDGLREGLDRLHELAADIEEAPVELGVSPNHLGEVVTGAECRTVAPQDDDRRFAGFAYRLQAAYQLSHVV